MDVEIIESKRSSPEFEARKRSSKMILGRSTGTDDDNTTNEEEEGDDTDDNTTADDDDSEDDDSDNGIVVVPTPDEVELKYAYPHDFRGRSMLIIYYRNP